MSDLPATRASDAEREHAVARLREASADGRLTLDEFTERMHAVYAARTHDELETLLRDLPERAPAPTPARRRRALSVMGNGMLDLRDAVEDVNVSVLCVMGNLAVVVPRGARIELDPVAIMGNKRAAGQGEGGGPRVHVTGLVVMGNLVVQRA